MCRCIPSHGSVGILGWVYHLLGNSPSDLPSVHRGNVILDLTAVGDGDAGQAGLRLRGR